MIEKLQQKREILVAQRAQLLAQVNATEGAIAICDELIRETLAEQSQAMQRQPQEAGAAATETRGRERRRSRDGG